MVWALKPCHEAHVQDNEGTFLKIKKKKNTKINHTQRTPVSTFTIFWGRGGFVSLYTRSSWTQCKSSMFFFPSTCPFSPQRCGQQSSLTANVWTHSDAKTGYWTRSELIITDSQNESLSLTSVTPSAVRFIFSLYIDAIHTSPALFLSACGWNVQTCPNNESVNKLTIERTLFSVIYCLYWNKLQNEWISGEGKPRMSSWL